MSLKYSYTFEKGNFGEITENTTKNDNFYYNTTLHQEK